MSKAGEAIYLSLKEQELIREAINMLETDYHGDHPEMESLDKIHSKMSTEMDRKVRSERLRAKS